MKITIMPTAGIPGSGAPVAAPRMPMPSLLPARIRTSWRRVPTNGGALSAAAFTHRTTAVPGALSGKQADRGLVAKQASPPRGTG
jgi:hypothetical protein